MDWTDAGLKARMRRGWRGAISEGSPCGNGSLLKNTDSVRSLLPDMLVALGARTVCDAGAGDMYWQQGVLSRFDYRPFDLVPRASNIRHIDITKTALPKCDVIICRLVLIHLDPPRVLKALELFKQSGKVLFASQYDVTNTFDASNQFNRTNLIEAPYNLGEPIGSIPDLREAGCSLSAWRLER